MGIRRLTGRFASAGMRERSFLGAVLDVETESGWFVVEYNGRGMGHESVYVNGRLVARAGVWFWFVPRFEFQLGPLPAALEVRVWPWLAFRSFTLTVAGRVVYR